MKWLKLISYSLLSYIWLALACSLFLFYVESLPSSEINIEHIRISRECVNCEERKPIKWIPITYIGRVTYYCSCNKCTRGLGITRNGSIPREGITVACDPEWLNKHVRIGKLGSFKCEDTGRDIRFHDVDVYIQNHDDAKRLGISYQRIQFY